MTSPVTRGGRSGEAMTAATGSRERRAATARRVVLMLPVVMNVPEAGCLGGCGLHCCGQDQRERCAGQGEAMV